MIEDHYSAKAGHPQPMDIEWAKDGITGELFIVQARPETVHSSKTRAVAAEIYRVTGEHGPALVAGRAVGEKIGARQVRIVREASKFN